MKNKLNLSLLFGIVFLFSICSAMAILTVASVDSPSATAVLNTTTVNVSVTVTGPMTNFSCNVYAKSANTANSSWSEVIAVGTQNDSALIWNSTFDTKVLEDANTYSINVSCTNGTGSADTATASTITIDNTIPDAATIPIPSDGTTVGNGTFTFGTTVTGTETTGCTLLFDGNNPGSSSYTMTHSGDTCTYSFASSEISEESYKWYVRASDGSNTTDSSKWITNINFPTPHKGALILKDQPSSTGVGKSLSVGGSSGSLSDIPNWVIVLIVVGIVGAVLYFKRK